MTEKGKFLRTCVTCQGAGRIEHPEWCIWRLEHSTPPPEGHPLLDVKEEMLCPECFGFGTIYAKGPVFRMTDV